MKVLLLAAFAMSSFAVTAVAHQPYPRTDSDCKIYEGVDYLNCLRVVNRDKG